MSDDIPLTNDGGYDPRKTFCRRCGCDTKEIIVGDNRLMKNSKTGEIALAPKTHISQVRKELGWDQADFSVVPVPPGKLPASEFCGSCKAEVDQFETAVAAGGLYWSCTNCGLNGVIQHCDYATEFRVAAGVLAPNPLQLEFETCKDHADIGIAAPQ